MDEMISKVVKRLEHAGFLVMKEHACLKFQTNLTLSNGITVTVYSTGRVMANGSDGPHLTRVRSVLGLEA